MSDRLLVHAAKTGGLGGAGGFGHVFPSPLHHNWRPASFCRGEGRQRAARTGFAPLSPVRAAHFGGLAVLAMVDGLIMRSEVFGDPRGEGSHDRRSMPIVLDAGNDGIAFEGYIAKGGRHDDLIGIGAGHVELILPPPSPSPAGGPGRENLGRRGFRVRQMMRAQCRSGSRALLVIG